MELEITGTETPEQLEAMLENIGEVEIDTGTDTPQETSIESLESPESKSEEAAEKPEQSEEDADGKSALMPENPEEPSRGIMARDGKHIIPYDVLEAERADKQRIITEALELRQQLQEQQRRAEILAAQISQAGMSPDPLPEKAKFTGEQLAGIREAYPELADTFTLMARKMDYLEARMEAERAPAPALPAPLKEALEAVPELNNWRQSDPDRFALAVHLDERLQGEAAWKDKTLIERFTEVARRTRAAYGGDNTAPGAADSPGDAATKTSATAARMESDAQKAAQLPVSPSDIGMPGAQEDDAVTRALKASPEELTQMMARMSQSEIESLLERAGL